MVVAAVSAAGNESLREMPVRIGSVSADPAITVPDTSDPTGYIPRSTPVGTVTVTTTPDGPPATTDNWRVDELRRKTVPATGMIAPTVGRLTCAALVISTEPSAASVSCILTFMPKPFGVAELTSFGPGSQTARRPNRITQLAPGTETTMRRLLR